MEKFVRHIMAAFSLRMDRLRSAWVARRLALAGEHFRIGKDSIVIGGEYIRIGDGFIAHARTRLEAYGYYRGIHYSPRLVIGNNVSMGYDCHIGAINSIEIADNVMLASKVYITDHFHGNTGLEDLQVPPAERTLYSKGPVIIEENAWIGESAVILPNVRIGRGAVVGANAVVTRDVPQYSIVAGVPARVISRRDDGRTLAPDQQDN